MATVAGEKDLSNLKKIAESMKKLFGKSEQGERNDPCESLRQEMIRKDRAAAAQLVKVLAAMLRGGPALVVAAAAELAPLVVEYERAKQRWIDCLIANNNPNRADAEKQLKQMRGLRAQLVKEKDKLG